MSQASHKHETPLSCDPLILDSLVWSMLSREIHKSYPLRHLVGLQIKGKYGPALAPPETLEKGVFLKTACTFTLSLRRNGSLEISLAAQYFSHDRVSLACS